MGKDDFYRYLQVRHYFNQNLKEALGKTESEFLREFLSFYESKTCSKVISSLYKAIQLSKQDSTEYIKKRWEKEVNAVITMESWENICQLPWISTGSNTWREFAWKNVVRFFVTPIQVRHQDKGDACWRLCGTTGANHFHIFWDCQVIKDYWGEVQEHISNVFGMNIPLHWETMYLGDILLDNWATNDKRLLCILLVASKKAITRKWLRVEPPTIGEWIDIVYKIYIMEKLSFSLKVQKERFYKIWTKWTEYVKPIRLDFI